MRWQDFGPFEKGAIGVLFVLFVLGWLAALVFGNWRLFFDVPFFAVFGAITVLYLLGKCVFALSWVRQKLRR